MKPDIHKVGLLVVRDNRILLCRQWDAPAPLILPGGKIEPGETEEQCLSRELTEELGDVHTDGLWKIGTYVHRAATRPGEAPRAIQVELYGGQLQGEPEPRSEISELVWFGENDDPASLAPSIRERILPDLAARNILPWPAYYHPHPSA